jgi:hypothetical protein
MGEKVHAPKIFVGKSEGKRPLGRRRRKWEDNIRMDIQKIEWTGFNWLRMETSDGVCEHSNDPSGAVQDGEFLD